MSRLARRTSRILVATALAAALSAGALVDPAAAAPADTYIVSRGDSISLIAMKMKVKVKDLLAANQLTINSMIFPGDVIQVPAGGIVPNAPAATPSVYTVVRGDSLIRIAKLHKVTLNDLLSLNKLSTSSLIYPGMKLQVPTTTAAPAPSPTTSSTTIAPAPAAPAAVYVVTAGDYLAKIASTLKVSLDALLSANKLTVKSVIYPGDRLVVPAGGVLPAPTTAAPTTAAPTTAAPTSSTPATGPTAANPIDAVIAFATAQIGKPYQFNTAGPEAYDCSGLTLAAYAVIGISLPHYSGAQSMLGSRVDFAASPIRPGDLVFLESSIGSGIISHVGIAVSATEWIQAPRSGEFVRKGTFSMTRVVAVRRFVGA